MKFAKSTIQFPDPCVVFYFPGQSLDPILCFRSNSIFRSTFPIQYFGQPAGLPHSLSSWLPIYDVRGINLPHTLLPPCPGETAWPIPPTRLPTPRRVGAIQAVNMMHCMLWPWWVKHWSWSVYWIDWQTLITPEQCSRKQRQNSQHKPNNVKKTVRIGSGDRTIPTISILS